MKTRSAGPMITVAEGWDVPSEITIEVDDHGGYTVKLIAEYRPESGRYETRKVTVRRADGSGEVTGEALRLIPVAGILRQGIAAEILPSVGPVPDHLAQAGPTQETLTWVALTYSLALLLGDAPTQRVANTLGIARSTAGRWVTRARDRGILSVTDPRGTRG